MTTYYHGIEVIEIDDGSRPIEIKTSSVSLHIGTAPDADTNLIPENEPVWLTGTKLRALGNAGTLPWSVAMARDQAIAPTLVIRIPTIQTAPEDPHEEAQLNAVVGSESSLTGVYAALGAMEATGLKPKIITAAGWTHQRPGNADNPVVAALQGVAERLRAVVIKDGPNTTPEAAIQDRASWGGTRTYVLDPWVKRMENGATIERPASSAMMGVIARMDAQKGYWWSPSNQPIYGITGVSRKVPFIRGDRGCEAQVMNQNHVGTIVSIPGRGRVIWGNRSTSSDTQWMYLSVRRTADMVYEAVEYGHDWAVDRPIDPLLPQDMLEGVNSFMRHQTAIGASLGGQAWLDPELNTPDQIKLGRLYVDFDLRPPTPLEHGIFRAHLNDGYFTEVLAQQAA